MGRASRKGCSDASRPDSLFLEVPIQEDVSALICVSVHRADLCLDCICLLLQEALEPDMEPPAANPSDEQV